MLEYSFFARYCGFTLVEICIIDIYCVHISVIIKMDVNSVIFHINHVIIIEASSDFFEHDDGAIVEVNVHRWL